MHRLKNVARAGFVVLVAGCAADAGSPLGPSGDPTAVISDAAHVGAVPGFYFLPPMVPQPAYSGTFDAGVQPRVEVCELAGTACSTLVAQWTLSSGVTVNAGAELYQVNWRTGDHDLDPAKHYRISVFSGAFRLGYADVDVVGSGKDLKNVDTQEFIPLLDGRTLPIKFRIETGIVGAVVVSPDSAEVPIGGTQPFTATLLDLHGNPMAGPTVTWASSHEAVATVDQTGLFTGVSPGATTITATAQAASGTAALTVFNPNQPPVAAPDTFDAIGNFTVPVSAPGVLANDSDPDANPLQAVPGTFATAQGGTFTLDADGSFTYLSAAGFTGEDEVAYEVTDGLATASSTVTFVVPTRVWYVSNAGGAPGDGRDASPFTALKSAEAASLAGEAIFVLAGDGTSTGLDAGIVLKNAQALTGQGVAANVTATLNGETVVLLAAGSAPQLTRADAGATVALAQDNTVQGVDVASSAGAGIAGAGFGTLTAGNVSVSATGGPSLDLSDGTAAATFGALSSAGSAGTGLRLASVGGVISAPAGSIAGAAGTGIEVSGGDADVTYGGNVASVGPRPIAVTGRTGGTLTLSGTIASTGQGILAQGNGGGTIALTGASKSLSTGASHGVELASNAGAAVHFGGGGLAVATTTGEAFRATGGGTVTVTGAGNTLSAAGGAALRVANTTIGAAGLTFRSVAATGGANGIVLENTGMVNGVQVTGDGSTAGSGGTIQNTGTAGILAAAARNLSFSFMDLVNAATVDGGGVGACDAAVSSGCNGAVKLVDVQNVTLRSLAVTGSAEQGVIGRNVTGITIASSTISGAGNAAGESGIYLDGVFGTANAITGTTVTGSGNHNLYVLNTSATQAAPGTADRLTITGSTFSNAGTAVTSDGILVALRAAANFATELQATTISGSAVDCVQVDADDMSRSAVTVQGSTLTGCNTGINLSGRGATATTFDVRGNPLIRTVAGTGVNIAAVGAAAMRGTVADNANVTTSSASNNGMGVDVVVEGAGSAVVDVNGNTVSGFAIGIRGGARGTGTGTADLTVRNNQVTSGGSFEFAGAYFFAGNGSAGESNRTCVNFSANQVASSVPWASDYWLEQWTGNTFQLEGFTGDGTDEAAVEAFVASRDTGAADVEALGGTEVSFSPGSCATP